MKTFKSLLILLVMWILLIPLALVACIIDGAARVVETVIEVFFATILDPIYEFLNSEFDKLK